MVRYHKQELPDGKIKYGRIVKRASGWYLCLFISCKASSDPYAHRSSGCFLNEQFVPLQGQQILCVLLPVAVKLKLPVIRVALSIFMILL